MLLNPFTPSTIVSSPEEFFGRQAELQTLARSLRQGSVAIYGGVGIGKSSLLARVLLHMDEFMVRERCDFVTVVGHSDIKTVDDAARLILEQLTSVDQSQNKLRISLKFIEYESGKSFSFFSEGRHLAALSRLLEEESFKQRLRTIDHLVIAVDEADKCPRALARLIRSVSTKTQLAGITNIKFVLAGVSPFFDEMLAEDEGIARMFYKHIPLGQLKEDEACDLLESKLDAICKDAYAKGIALQIGPETRARILQLSGWHPHLIQLLGSHMVERECEDPDEVLDSHDLVGSLRAICYEARAGVYDRLIHLLEIEERLNPFLNLLHVAEPGLPTFIERQKAQGCASNEDLEWLRSHNFIIASDSRYQLMDEFLRIRLMLDQDEREDDRLERLLLVQYSDDMFGSNGVEDADYD